jgi:WD40 repeat protein
VAIPFFQGAAVVALDRPNTAVRTGPQEDVRSAALSPDGRLVVTGSHNNTDRFGARVWEAATGRLVERLRVRAPCLAGFSPDGRWLVTTGGGCRVWAVDGWAEGPRLGGEAFAFSPDSRTLAVEGELGAVRLVETATGREIARLEGPEQTRLWPKCFSPDGGRLFVLGEETRELYAIDLRAIRAQLAEMGLDWDAPPLPPAPPALPAVRLILQTGAEKDK